MNTPLVVASEITRLGICFTLLYMSLSVLFLYCILLGIGTFYQMIDYSYQTLPTIRHKNV